MKPLFFVKPRAEAFALVILLGMTSVPFFPAKGGTGGDAHPMGSETVAVADTANSCRLVVDPRQGVWSWQVAGKPVISAAKVEVVLPSPVAIPKGSRFLRFRLFQHGGDWDAYIGYLEFRAPGQSRPFYRDSFTSQTPRDKYVRAENLMWRTASEGGLICPKARDVWAEIIYQTTATEIRWVAQAVTSRDVIEVEASPDGRSWQRLLRKSGEGGISPRFGDDDAVPLADSQVVSLGAAEWSTARVQDRLGPARQLTLSRTLPTGLRLTARFSLVEAEPVLAIDLSLSNTTAKTLPVLELRPGAGFTIDLAAPAERCTVISSDYWFAPRAIVRLDQQEETTEWWSTAVVDRATERTLVLGIGEAANAGITYRLHRRGLQLGGDIRANLSPARGGVPLNMPGGATFSLCRLLLLSAHQVHAGLERYADLLAKNAAVKVRQRAFSGLFTGYSSAPELTTVVRLDEQRVLKLLDLLQRKVGRYGIDFVKIEFEPAGSPNLLDRGRYRMEEHFPKGPRALTDAIRGLGFRPALQSRTFSYVRGGDPQERQKTTDIYRRFTRDWGFQYLMLDFNETDIRNDDLTRPLIQVFRDRFRMIREAVGPEVFLEGCMIPYGPLIGIADGYRPSQDFRGGNENSLLSSFATRYHLHGRIFQLDTEFHDIAQRPFVWGKRDLVTPLAGTRAWVSLCALSGYSYLFGGALEETSDERFAIASRALPVSGVAARPIDLAERPWPQIWSLPVSRAAPLRQTIGLFNWDYEGTKLIQANLARCGLPGGKTFTAFDFWQQRFLGEVDDQILARLPPRSTRVVWLTEITGRPEIIGCSRHVTGFFSGRILSWHPETLTLQGVVRGHGDDRVSLFLYIPQRLPVRSCKGASFEQVEQRVVRLDVPTSRPETTWTLTLDRAASVR